MSSSNTVSIRSIGSPAASTTASAAMASARHAAVERRYVEAVEHQVQGLHLIMADVGDDAAERRRDAGKARHQRGSQADLA